VSEYLDVSPVTRPEALWQQHVEGLTEHLRG